MSAFVLSVFEQKKALSSSKKKKKNVKNILALPSNNQTQFHGIQGVEEENVCKLLKRLLPTARIPVQQYENFPTGKKEFTPEELAIRATAKAKRIQMSIGVNETNKNLKKDKLSAVLLARDIQPKFLVHHLNLLCSHNKVPYLHIPQLREITRTNLGFPSIVLGFKKDYNDFSDVVELVKSISSRFVEKVEEDNIEPEEMEVSEGEVEILEEKSKPFTYLYRTSVNERIFIPEEKSEKPEKGFIAFIKETDEPKLVMKGISQNLNEKKKKRDILKVIDVGISGSDEEDFEVPKKKAKKSWVIDTVGNKPKYSSVKLFKLHSNPDRMKKKKK